jgi:hypothetical protein
VAAAALLLALAVGAVLLAGDVRSWQRTMAAGDAIYAAEPGRAQWTPSTRLGGLSGNVLGTADDVALRRAVRLYRATAGVEPRLDDALEVQSARARTQDALEAAARSSVPAAASQARTLLGVLAFGSAAAGGEQSQVDAAASDFADAITADPGNADAKYDLELLLRLSAAHGARPGQAPAGAGTTGRKGAGGGSPGTGY